MQNRFYFTYEESFKVGQSLKRIADSFQRWQHYNQFLDLAKSQQTENAYMCQQMFRNYLKEREEKTIIGLAYFAGHLFDVVSKRKNMIVFEVKGEMRSNIIYNFRKYWRYHMKKYFVAADDVLQEFSQPALFWGKNDRLGKKIILTNRTIINTINLISEAQYHNKKEGPRPYFVCASIKKV